MSLGPLGSEAYPKAKWARADLDSTMQWAVRKLRLPKVRSTHASVQPQWRPNRAEATGVTLVS